MKWWKGFDRILGNPFERGLRRAVREGHREILLCWNRGLGDIALGLYALVATLRMHLPGARVTFLVREGLLEGFSLLEGVTAIAVPHWRRHEPYSVAHTCSVLGLDLSRYDWVIEWPNPTRWMVHQLGTVQPRLRWDPRHDLLAERFGLPRGPMYIGVQLDAETGYGLWRNWPMSHWHLLLQRLAERPEVRVLLFGMQAQMPCEGSHLIDLRGKTSLFELLALIRMHCQALIVPDSGILAMTYFLDAEFPLRLVSLWADPKHGVLKQSVPSPNPRLLHRPLIGAGRDLSTVSPEAVLHALAL